MKAVSTALTVIIELAQVSLDYATWKLKLKPKVSKAVENWRKETIPTILNDLEKLKKQNIETINQIAKQIENTFESDTVEQQYSEEDFMKQLKECDEIGRKIGVI